MNKSVRDADIVIVATPTDYSPENNYFDTSPVDTVIQQTINVNRDALIVIKSTIPVGHTENLQKEFDNKNIIFSPEFLREGKALEDNLYPSRIIIGCDSKRAKEFANLLDEATLKENNDILFLSLIHI